jgi:hypothetical protein
MVTIASPTVILIISVIKPIISLVLISLRKRMTFSPLVIIGISISIVISATTVNISSWGTPEEGIYIDTMICSKPISMLVDTGASVTILSQKF